MRTKKRLIELANKSESLIYKEIANTLSKKIFIAEWSIKYIKSNPFLKYNLYDSIINDLWVKKYFYVNQDEIKKLLIKDFWHYHTYCLHTTELKSKAIDYTFDYYIDKIIKELKS